MTNRRRPRRLAALGLGVSITLAACSGGGDSQSAPSSDVVSSEPTTAAAAPSTTAAATTAVPSTEPATTTTIPAPPSWPLTGLERPADQELNALRPAVAVKLDNHREARPHAGLNQADIVFEEIVEAQITRFFAVFHSNDAAPIGPIRSARTTDIDLLNMFNRPLFAWSGGNRGVVQAIGTANAESRAHGQRADLYYRDAERRRRTAVEHTLFLKGTQDIWATISPGQGVPTPIFSYRTAADSPLGEDMAGFDLNMRSVPITWTWDEASGFWLRDEYGEPHTDTGGIPIAVPNVVVQFLEYGTSVVDARSPEGYSVGSGDALVFSAGKVQLARWDRPSPDVVPTFTTSEGTPVLLTPGRTWVELAEAGVSQITPA